PDLFLALANLEASNESRKKWINNMLEMYDLKPIAFCSEKTDATYDDVCTKASYQKMDGPKISVILPAYNSEKGIRIAIESILSQTWGNIELLIVDDCSTDNTLDVIQSYANKDSRIVVLKTPQNSGPYAARNIALRKARDSSASFIEKPRNHRQYVGTSSFDGGLAVLSSWNTRHIYIFKHVFPHVSPSPCPRTDRILG